MGEGGGMGMSFLALPSRPISVSLSARVARQR
jgi:hypothetical protein